MDSARDSIIPPNLDIFHHRALQERSPNLRHEHSYGYYKYDNSYFKNGRHWHIGSEPTSHRPIYVSGDPRNISKPKLTSFEKEQVFQKLWMRAWSCESFTKYRNNQKKCSKRAKDQIWSDRNEYLFFRGLVEFWPTGRVQQIDDRFEPKKAKGKPEFGRNELIARWMGQELGYDIKRKEISSHLQVLKAKFRSEATKDDFVLYWLGLDPKKSEAKQIEAMAELIPRQVQRDVHVLNPVQFDMRIREIDLYGHTDNTAHLIAYSTASAKKMDQYLTAIPAWRRDYPMLSSILDDAHHQGVEIMLVDCPLNLLNATELREIRTNAANKNCTVDLSIQNKFRLRSQISARESWDCKTTFFQKGEAVEPWINEAPVRIKTDAVHTHWDGEYQTLMIPFKSDHWLDIICQFANRLDNPAEALAVEKDVEEMLVVQEIQKHQNPSDGEEAAEDSTVLVILWTFHTSSRDRPVPSTWHTVFLPFEPIADPRLAIFRASSETPANSSIPLYLDYDQSDQIQSSNRLDEASEIIDFLDTRNNSLAIELEDSRAHRRPQSMTQAGSHIEHGFDIPDYNLAAIPGMEAEMNHHAAAAVTAQHMFDPHLFDDFHNVSRLESPQITRNHSQLFYDPYQTRQSFSQPVESLERQFFLDPFNPNSTSASFPPAFWYGPGAGSFPLQAQARQAATIRRPTASSFDTNVSHGNDVPESSIDLGASGRRLQRLAAIQPFYRTVSSSGPASAALPGQQQQQLQTHTQTQTQTPRNVISKYGTQGQPPMMDITVCPTVPSQNVVDFPEPLMSSAPSSPTTARRISPRHCRKQAVAIAPHEIQEFQDSPLISPTNIEMLQVSDSAAIPGEIDLHTLEQEQLGYFSGSRRSTRRIEEVDNDEDEDGSNSGVKRRRITEAD